MVWKGHSSVTGTYGLKGTWSNYSKVWVVIGLVQCHVCMGFRKAWFSSNHVLVLMDLIQWQVSMKWDEFGSETWMYELGWIWFSGK